MLWLDHVTSFVNDRHAAAEALRAAGLHAVEGGVHTGFGSANDLSHFGLFYLELLEITDPFEAAASGSEVCRYAVDFLQDGEGLATFALETDDLAGDVRRLRAAGYTVPEPIRMQRVHDDGFISHSTIAYPSNDDLPIRAPIIIERSIAPEQRAPLLTARGTIAEHHLGDAEVRFVAVAVPDAVGAARRIAHDYGVAADEVLSPAPELDGDSCAVHFGRAELRFVQPSGPGAAADRLRIRGAGPFAVGISVGEHGLSQESLDIDLETDEGREGLEGAGVLEAAGIRFVVQKHGVHA